MCLGGFDGFEQSLNTLLANSSAKTWSFAVRASRLISTAFMVTEAGDEGGASRG
jgi:hypothetical protein